MDIFKKIIKYVDDYIFSGLLWSTSTKAAFYSLTILIIIATILSPPLGVQAWLLLIVSIYYQGVALPGVGYAGKQAEKAANLQGEMTRKLLQDTHDQSVADRTDIKESLGMLHDDNVKLDDIKNLLNEIASKLDTKNGG